MKRVHFRILDEPKIVAKLDHYDLKILLIVNNIYFVFKLWGWGERVVYKILYIMKNKYALNEANFITFSGFETSKILINPSDEHVASLFP